jgi:hypothetical protein
MMRLNEKKIRFNGSNSSWNLGDYVYLEEGPKWTAFLSLRPLSQNPKIRGQKLRKRWHEATSFASRTLVDFLIFPAFLFAWETSIIFCFLLLCVKLFLGQFFFFFFFGVFGEVHKSECIICIAIGTMHFHCMLSFNTSQDIIFQKTLE